MTLTKQVIASACGLLLCTLLVATVQAQGLPNQKTYFTFSQAVELPGGVMLPAGKYTFKLADTSGSRNVVQVFNEDESKILAMFMTVSASRLEPAEDSVITFAEAPASAPQPVRFWLPRPYDRTRIRVSDEPGASDCPIDENTRARYRCQDQRLPVG